MTAYCVYSGGDGTSGAVAGSVPTSTEWSHAYQSLAACSAAHATLNAGDIVFIASDHSVTTNLTTACAFTLPASPSAPAQFLSISRTTNLLTPGASEMQPGAGGGTAYQFNGSFYMFGVTLSSPSSSIVSSTAVNKTITLEDSTLYGYSVAQNGFNWGNLGKFTMRSGNIALQVTGNAISFYGMDVELIGVNLLNSGCKINASASNIVATGCNFSAATVNPLFNNTAAPSSIHLRNSKLGSTALLASAPSPGGIVLEAMSCSASDHNYNYYRQDGCGVTQADTGHYLTTNPAQIKDVNGLLVPYSLSLAGTANASRLRPLFTPWSSVFNALTGSRTVSMQVAYDSATALLNADLWMEVEFLGDTTSPMATVELSAPEVSGTQNRDILAAGTALTDPATAWTGTFTNKKTATLSKTVTIQNQGYVRVRVGTSSTVPVYFDPTISVV